MPDIDLFMFFRLVVNWAVTIYATIVTFQALWGWYVWLAGRDRYVSLIRRYLVVHGLRLRFREFWADLIICLLLCVALVLLWEAQNIMIDIDRIVRHG